MRPAYAVIGLGLIMLALASLAGVDSCKRKQAVVGEATANVAHGEADAHVGTATQADAEVLRIKSEAKTTEANLARARAEVQRLRGLMEAQAGAGVPHTGVPVAPLPDPDPGVDLHRQVDLAQGELIQAQDAQIVVLTQENMALTKARDEWKLTAEARNREAAGLRIALDAQKSLNRTGSLKASLGGLTIGLGAGFLAGRLK